MLPILYHMQSESRALVVSVLRGDTLQHALKVCHVVVPEAQDARPRQVAPILDAEVHVLQSK